MKMRRLAQWFGIAGLAFAAQACVVRDAQPVNAGYGYSSAGSMYASGGIYVGEPSVAYANSMPPPALYETMTPSPGYGYVWIDGYWHWNSFEWVWVSGRWVQEQQGYYYVQPYYDYSNNQYVYYPGYWTTPDRMPPRSHVQDHRGEGRPPVVVRPPMTGQPPIVQPGYNQPPIVQPPVV